MDFERRGQGRIRQTVASTAAGEQKRWQQSWGLEVHFEFILEAEMTEMTH